MGSPDFAVPSLDALVESKRFAPLLVASQPDKPRGRGREVSPTPVRQRAIERGIPSMTMSKETYADGVRVITEARPDIVVVVAFGLILRRDLLDFPEYGCINVHASLLPKLRGVSPIQAAILAGEKTTGCTTMHIDEGVDTGDMLLQDETPILDTDTAGTLSDRLAELGAKLLIKTLDGLIDGSVKPRAQDHTLATHTKKIKKAHGAIDWTRDAAYLARHVRAMSPWPTAYTYIGATRLIVEEAAPGSPQRGAPGVVISLDPLTVATGDGTLELRVVRPEGKRGMSAREFAAGYRVQVGDVLRSD
ncbi:MAG: methionyl-tRNA formyltransferase [Candidatus Latescibacteria bacterium]|nr:methionyl-tRNA formyltransferase [Candidatus Latescibacterota bacterium]